MTNSMNYRVAATGLVAGVVCLSIGDLLSELVVSSAAASDAEINAAVGAHLGMWSSAAALLVLGAVLFLPGLIGLVLTSSGRGARLTVTGGSLLAIGLVGSVGHVVHYFGMYGTYARAQLPETTIETLSGADGAVVTTDLVIVVFLVGFILGTVLLMIGLRRGGRIPIWAAVAGVVYVIAANSSSPTMSVLELLAGLAAYVPAALWLIRAPGSQLESDAPERLPSKA